MKHLLILFWLMVSASKALACGGEYFEWMSFYTLFDQKNISHQAFKPFLRDSDNKFYDEDGNYYYGEDSQLIYNEGNIKLWQELLKDWSKQEIETAVYNPTKFNWKTKKGKLLTRIKTYIDYANFCSNIFAYRKKLNSWDYDKILEQNKHENLGKVIGKGNELFSSETVPQLKARYAYQIVRLFHYSKNWNDGIKFFNQKVKGKFPKDEIYYYTIDQVGGCYYSINQFDQAAHLFSKVVNHSLDRKKSAFNSFDFCVNQNADGHALIVTDEDKKDYQFIKSLDNFSDDFRNLMDFIELDANDDRVEVLFVRAINKLESQMLPKNYGYGDKLIPYFEKDNDLSELIGVSDSQIKNAKVKNKDFWYLANSYLNFLELNLEKANSQLAKVKGFKDQKTKLAIVYKVFSWDKITAENENELVEIMNGFKAEEGYGFSFQSDFQDLLLDYVAHQYYAHDDIAKSFLVHNYIEQADDLSSLTLMDRLEKFYHKPNKSAFEEILLGKVSEAHDFMDYVNRLYGVYYLHNFDPQMAMEYFNRCQKPIKGVDIPASIFSNNTIECFRCESDDVMVDEVYKAEVFNFIKPTFGLKELTQNLIKLEEMTNHETKWKGKLANYLLANYYFNISNTGYYRGVLTNRHDNNYAYFGYSWDKEGNLEGDNIIDKKTGYNLMSVSNYPKNYFGASLVSANYYKKVIEMSTDKELNARCLYMISKCELNRYYNGFDTETYLVEPDNKYSLELPKSEAFYQLKYNYRDTKFHDMIIKECSYFRLYSNRF